jgi:hypothetical protein
MGWAADNQAFTGFSPGRFFPWLETMQDYRELCLFVACPDLPGDACGTLALFDRWAGRLAGWPVAFVAQDGQEEKDFPPSDLWQVLFVGGSTAWKVSAGAQAVIKRAQAQEKGVHIGRVNWWRRFRLFAEMYGSEKFTCDGTRTRYDGVEKTLAAWADYQGRPVAQRR